MMLIWRIEKLLVFLLIIVPSIIIGRKHHLHLENDSRRIIQISTFGFFKGGRLSVQLYDFVIRPDTPSPSSSGQVIGFTVDRTLNDGLNPYSQNVNVDRSYCPLTSPAENSQRLARLSLIFNFANKTNPSVKVQCSSNMEKIFLLPNTSPLPYSHSVPKKPPVHIQNVMIQQRRRRSPEDGDDAPDGDIPQPPIQVDMNKKSVASVGQNEPKKDIGGPADGVVIDSISPNDNKKSTPEEQVPNSNVSPPSKDANDVLNENKNDIASPPASSSKSPVAPFLPPDSPNEDQQSFVDPALGGNGWPVDGVSSCSNMQLPLIVKNNVDGPPSYSTNFTVFVVSEDLEGLYNLYFHNCLGEDTSIDLNMSIVEQNEGENYLSAGEMPLPGLYLIMSIVFFVAGCLWVYILKKSKRESGVSVFKIHYLMGALMYLKSLSLLFHSINYYSIQTEGTHVEGFAVLYYTVHLLKGALLFITILLIGTGYAFVKHLLSDKDKKIFMIVIPLQVLANVADIIIEESEEGEIVHTTWKVIFISLDLLCCGAILFPVVWSIRHLQEASRTDGKAATNLRKLKLFRHFYIIVVCYIYFTRIIVNLLLKITIPFQYEWLDEMFLELTTFIFFVLTGYKFRPAANNPYLELAHDSDDETDIALTESGLTEGVSKRGGRVKKKTLKEIVLFDPNDEDTDDDEEVLLEKSLLETSRSRV